MKKKIFMLFVLLLLFPVSNKKVWGTDCVCISTGIDCVEKSPSGCEPGERCACENDAELDPGTGLVNCRTGGANCVLKPTPTPSPTPFAFCTGPHGEGIQTALGCIPTKEPTQFIAWLLKFAIGIGGGIAFLMMVLGAIKVLTSSGNPEAVKAGQELITSALTGLLFIIFSLFLLQLIGVKILNIPGFGTP